MDLPSVINLLYNSGTRRLTDQMPSLHHINEQQHWLTVSHSDRCGSVTASLQGTKLHQRWVGFEPHIALIYSDITLRQLERVQVVGLS